MNQLFYFCLKGCVQPLHVLLISVEEMSLEVY